MAYWLVKSEPGAWSWQQQVDAGTTHWDGVRNHQAVNNLKAMRVGDRVMFYHSGEAREIVGIVEVARAYYPDPNDPSGRFGMVDVRTVGAPPPAGDARRHQGGSAPAKPGAGPPVPAFGGADRR